ncbi:uncharacterized protein LOC122860076 [Aphidius gifuensis]|uniref:uncharacterized protein LOC122860076 n=1 Tax=Aphidius gifuensis TaxID=684658 RepID=UPI001CDB5469|nr:uncharacterized protein LOC122860076 [Aphidius gifuensis]
MEIIKENDDDDEDEKNFENPIMDKEKKEKLMAHYDMLMFEMDHQFRVHPHFEKLCEDFRNKFVSSSFTTYIFHDSHYDEDYDEDYYHSERNDLKYVIDLCGPKLTCLDVTSYPNSQIMPLINNNCPNLKQLRLRFKRIESEDFRNVFSNMINLKGLRIQWECENSTLPMTLVESLEQVGGTLKYLFLRNNLKQNDISLPDSLAWIFPKLVALEELGIFGFGLSQPLLQSIGKIENLVNLRLGPYPENTYPVFDKNITMYPIGNLKTLKILRIGWNCGVTDEFLINLCNNAKQLQRLSIIGTNITDKGIIAFRKLRQLEYLDFCLIDIYSADVIEKKNEFITDKSIRSLCNQKLRKLDFSNCLEITNRSVIELVKKAPSLKHLYIKNTKVTFEVVEEISDSMRHRKRPIFVFVSFKNRNGAFESLAKSVNVHFVPPFEDSSIN